MPAGTIQLKVGLLPLPEIVTRSGKGTSGDPGGVPSAGVVVARPSAPSANARVHAPPSDGLKVMVCPQKFASTARPTHRRGPTVIDPWTAVRRFVPCEPGGLISTPNCLTVLCPRPTSSRL